MNKVVWGNVFAAVSVLVVLAWAATWFIGFRDAINRTELEVSQFFVKNPVQELRTVIDRLAKDVANIKEQEMAPLPIPEKSQVAAQLRRMENALKDLQTRHSKLEEVILNNPAKALETHLIRKDLDNVKQNQEASLLAVKQLVDNVYDLNKWLLGGMTISVITLAIATFYKTFSKPNETDSNATPN